MQPSLPMTPEASSPASGASSVRWSSVALFTVLAVVISSAIWLGLRALGVPIALYAPLGMFGPAIAATLIRGPLRHEGFADAGLRLVGRGQRGRGWMYLAAYLIIPALIAAGIGLSLLIGYQHWANPVHTIQQMIAQSLAATHHSPPPGISLSQLAVTTLMIQLVVAFTLGIVANTIFTFGEEFGWRGYLLPRLAPLGGPWAAILTGIIWGLWHAPIIMVTGYNFPGHPFLGAGEMALVTVPLSVIYAWLRFRSDSIWPSTLAHAAANAQSGFAMLVLVPAGDSLIRPPLGVLGVLPAATLALVVLLTGRVRALAPTHLAPAYVQSQQKIAPTISDAQQEV